MNAYADTEFGEFIDTHAPPGRGQRFPRADLLDTVERMRESDRADWALLRLVIAAAAATLAVAAAVGLAA
jgi:type II secretory pathway component PulL